MRDARRLLLQGVITLVLILCTSFVFAGEWKGLKIGVSSADDAQRVLGKPASVYPEYHLFTPIRIKSQLRPDTVVVNFNARGVIESMMIFPRWGLIDADIEEAFGQGQRMSYGAFLKQTGVTSFGAGTRPAEKLHYLPLGLPCEVYERKKILVLYDEREFTSGDQLVKLVIFY